MTGMTQTRLAPAERRYAAARAPRRPTGYRYPALLLAALSLSGLVTPLARAEPAIPMEDLAALDARVADVTGVPMGQPGGAAGKLDVRMRLARCPERAVIDAPQMDAVAIRCPSVGWRIRVPLVAASRRLPDAAAAPLVRRGDVVELIYEGEGFAATAPGTAMDDGAAGATIRVKTLTAAAPVTAMVSSTGEVRISR